jgi:hypothetical protein
MVISPEEAARTLADVGRATGRVATYDRYREASVYLFIWALVWFGANAALGLFPMDAGPWAWRGAGTAGVAASLGAAMIMRARRAASEDGGRWQASWSGTLRPFATALAFYGFFWAVMLVLPDVGPREGSAFICLVVAFAYIAMGVWMGWRLLVIGLASATLVLGGYGFLPPEHFLLWLAFVGSASLAAGGLWLRQA